MTATMTAPRAARTHALRRPNRPSRIAGCLIAAMIPIGAAEAADPPKEVRLGYFANVTHAQAVVGVSSGEFERAVAPCALTTKVFNAGPSLVEAIFAGEVDIGYIGPSPALSAHLQSRGRGVRVVAGAAANGVVIVAAPGSGIEKIEDLRGKRIATPQLGNTQDMSARHYLVNVLGQPNADNIIPIPNAEQAGMMARGQIDAAWAVEPWGARLVAEAGGTIIAEEKDLWPGGEFVLTLVIVSKDFLEKHPDVVDRFVAAHLDLTDRLAADPQSFAPAIADGITGITGKPMSLDIVRDALSRVKFTDEPLPDTLQAFAQRAADLGHARGVSDASTLVDQNALERARRLHASRQAPVSTP